MPVQWKRKPDEHPLGRIHVRHPGSLCGWLSAGSKGKRVVLEKVFGPRVWMAKEVALGETEDESSSVVWVWDHVQILDEKPALEGFRGIARVVRVVGQGNGVGVGVRLRDGADDQGQVCP